MRHLTRLVTSAIAAICANYHGWVLALFMFLTLCCLKYYFPRANTMLDGTKLCEDSAFESHSEPPGDESDAENK